MDEPKIELVDGNSSIEEVKQKLLEKIKLIL